MAYDKIIPIRRRMVRCIDYVLNEDKTDLANALNYTENPMKTQRLVTGVNCTPETALEEMGRCMRAHAVENATDEIASIVLSLAAD